MSLYVRISPHNAVTQTIYLFIYQNSTNRMGTLKNTVQALKYPSADAVTLYMRGFKTIN